VTALAIPEGNLGAGAAFLPEAVFLPLRQNDGHVVSSSVDELLQWQEQADVMLLGPGLGRSGETKTLVSSLWQNWGKPLIVDGDALWALSEAFPSLRHRSDALLTPHEGEAARLLFQEAKAVAKSRLESALSLSRRWGTTLLKGSDTLVTDGEKVYIISEGGPELAVPGSGDVLGGFIAALIARGQDTVTAAWGGALLHGMAGAALSSEIGQDGCLAREIAEKASVLLDHSCHESE
jgi:NAD(P)H-hydrate epimerase